MGRWIAIAAAVLVVLAVASQLVLPSLAEDGIEDRLTEGGGEASVSVSSVPAVRLLLDDGSRIEVRGSGLDLDVERETNVLGRLDGFEEVDVALDDFRAGPFEVASFVLARDGSGPYRLVSSSTTTAADVLNFGAAELGLPVGPLPGFLAGQAPGGDDPVPIELNMELESDDGRIRVVSGGGTVAGVPTGPLAELITAAIVVRL